MGRGGAVGRDARGLTHPRERLPAGSFTGVYAGAELPSSRPPLGPLTCAGLALASSSGRTQSRGGSRCGAE